MNLHRISLATAGVATAVIAALLPLPVALLLVGVLLVGTLLMVEPAVMLVFLLVFAPLRTLLNTESATFASFDPGQILLAATLAISGMVSVLQFHRIRLRELPHTLIPLLVFLAAISLSIISTVSVNGWLREWLKWIQIMLLALLVVVASRRIPLLYIVAAIVFAGAANAIIGLYQFFGGSGALHLLVNGRFFRAFGTFGQPNPFGAYMGILIPLAASVALAYLLKVWQAWQRSNIRLTGILVLAVFYALAAAIMAAGLIASWSRGAWLGFFASISIVTLSFPPRLWQSMALLISGSFAVTGAWFTGLVPQSIATRLGSITEDVFSLSDVRGVDITSANYAVVERLAHWQAALRMAEAEPFTGVGAGNYEIAYNNYRLINWVEPLGHAHNFYLNVLAETGIIGLVAYLIFWIVTFYFTWQARRHPDMIRRSIAVGLLGSWTYIAVHSLTDNLYVNNLFMHIGVLLGLLAVVHRDTFSFFRVE